MNPKKYIIIIAILWITALSLSLVWNIIQYRNTTQNEHLQTAKSIFEQVVITRSWNAKHGGLYLKVTKDIKPNPYLEVNDRDIVTTEGIELTKVNPAFMTRLISSLAEEKGKIKFHITSLQPINPANKPFNWERAALERFEKKGLKEFSRYEHSGNTHVFHYIAPLITEKGCLQCHAKQGYKEGDIRGGISVSFPIKPYSYFALVSSHLFILAIGLVLIFFFGHKNILLTEQLKKQSNVDGLTQIANRTFFDKTLRKEWRRSRRLHSPLSLILCDIDHFKLYNDTYGHQEGDECLRKVAKTLNQMVNRPTDMVARYGGEEFVVILPNTPAEGGKAIAEMMQAAIITLRIPHATSKSDKYITVSFGIATMHEDPFQEEELVNLADKALYASKKRGRNSVTHIKDLETM